MVHFYCTTKVITIEIKEVELLFHCYRDIELQVYIRNGKLIGDSSVWERERWSIPAFIRKDDLSRTAWKVIYSDDNPNKVIAEECVPYDSTNLEPDRLSGHRAAEIHLTRLLES